MNQVGTVDAGSIQVKVVTVVEPHRIGLFVVNQHDAAFYFTLSPPVADYLSGLLRDACDGKFIGRDFVTSSMQIKVTTVDHRIGVSISRRDAMFQFHFTLTPPETGMLASLLHDALVSRGDLSH